METSDLVMLLILVTFTTATVVLFSKMLWFVSRKIARRIVEYKPVL